MYVCRSYLPGFTQRPIEGIFLSRVIDDCEPLYVGAGNQTQDFRESSKHFRQLSHRSTPVIFFFLVFYYWDDLSSSSVHRTSFTVICSSVLVVTRCLSLFLSSNALIWKDSSARDSNFICHLLFKLEKIFFHAFMAGRISDKGPSSTLMILTW